MARTPSKSAKAAVAPKPEKPGNALFATLTRDWDEATIDVYSKSIEDHESDVPATVTAAFQTIDAKTSGLLTHVSMMIAGLGICAPMLAQHPYEEAIIIFEICVYLLIAVGCLRCLSVVRSVHYGASPENKQHHIRRELLIRHELYRLCNRVSIVFTIFVFMSLPAMLWWRPD